MRTSPCIGATTWRHRQWLDCVTPFNYGLLFLSSRSDLRDRLQSVELVRHSPARPFLRAYSTPTHSLAPCRPTCVARPHTSGARPPNPLRLLAVGVFMLLPALRALLRSNPFHVVVAYSHPESFQRGRICSSYCAPALTLKSHSPSASASSNPFSKARQGPTEIYMYR